MKRAFSVFWHAMKHLGMFGRILEQVQTLDCVSCLDWSALEFSQTYLCVSLACQNMEKVRFISFIK